MSAPAYPPAVLAALARYDDTWVRCSRERIGSPSWWTAYRSLESATVLLRAALDEHRVTRDAAMHAAESEALDEARRASPFRFTAKPRTEPML